MSSSYSEVSVSSIRLAPELGAIIVTVDNPAGARRLADGINAARYRVLQVSLHRIRLLGVGRERVVAFDLSVPRDLAAGVNPAAIQAVHFAAQGGKRHVATVSLEGVEVYPGFLPYTPRYLDGAECLGVYDDQLAAFRPGGWTWTLN